MGRKGSQDQRYLFFTYLTQSGAVKLHILFSYSIVAELFK